MAEFLHSAELAERETFATTQDQRDSELSILCATSFRVCGASFTTSYGSMASELELFRGANGARVFFYGRFQG